MWQPVSEMFLYLWDNKVSIWENVHVLLCIIKLFNSPLHEKNYGQTYTSKEVGTLGTHGILINGRITEGLFETKQN